METITLKIKNKEKLNHFLAFIKDLDFIEVLQSEISEKSASEKTADDPFFALAGIWEKRNVSTDDLRNAAWHKKN